MGHKGEASGQMSWVQMIRKYNDHSLGEPLNHSTLPM